MRLRQLELRRYGHFEDHTLNFGDGAVDFHLIVGPNEAGKSTLLTAIGDLLFEIPERTKLGFRHGMSELALAAWLEDGSDELRFVRRKKRKDPITDEAGNPISEAELARFLKGIDRATFESMYGLSYRRLAEGGRSILENRDDGARVVLEAEAGLTGLGKLIGDLEKEADDIFIPQGRTRLLHHRLKDLDDALKRSREATVEERAWAATVKKRKGLEADRAAIMTRLADIASELSVLERIRRTAPFIAQLDEYQRELAGLRDLPTLPANAAEQRTAADQKIATLTSARARSQSELDKARAQIDPAAVPAEILTVRDDIEALSDGRLLYVERVQLRPTEERKLRDSEASISAIRASAGVTADVPPRIVRERLRLAAEQSRDHEKEMRRFAGDRAKLAKELEVRRGELAALPDVTSLEPIKALYDAAPRRIAHLEDEAEKAVIEAQDRFDAAMHALLPWRGEIDALAALDPPSGGQLKGFEDRLAGLEERQRDAARLEQDARTRADALSAKLAAFADAGSELPTREALLEARAVRHERWLGVRTRLINRDRDPVADASAAAAMETAVDRADLIADRRHDEASRLATYKSLTDDLAAQTRASEAAADAKQAAEKALTAERATWRQQGTALGFAEPVTPARVTQWVLERQTALEAHRRLARAQAQLHKLRTENAAHIGVLKAALASAGTACPDDMPPDAVTASASAVVEALNIARADRKSVCDAIDRVQTELTATEAEIEMGMARAIELDAARTAALQAAGLPSDSDDIAIDAALDAFDDLDTAEGQKANAQATLKTLTDAIKAYEAQASMILKATGQRSSGDLSSDVRQLSKLLLDASNADEQHRKTQSRIIDLEAQLEDDEQALAVAKAVLDGLMSLAGALDAADLSTVIEQCARQRELELLRQDAEANLLKAGDGLAIEALRAEAEGKAVHELASAIELLSHERDDLNSRRESLGLELDAALREENTLSSGADAAAALQDAAEATADIAQQAERYVATRAAAVVLRWTLAKHRQTRAAPLLRRASALMSDITEGSIASLELDDFTEDGKPVIIGRRASGSAVAVEDMSEGTRDQLYLALRLASLEERLATHALPFVCDDLLINCDDERAALIIKALHAISKRAQVLCFTHHQHLTRVVEGAIGSDQVKLHTLSAASAKSHVAGDAGRVPA